MCLVIENIEYMMKAQFCLAERIEALLIEANAIHHSEEALLEHQLDVSFACLLSL